MAKNLPANEGDAWDISSTPGLERSPGEGNGCPLQYSCLENFMVTKSWTWLSSHAILLIRKLKLLQDNTDCSWKNQDSNSGIFYSKVILTWEQENNFPIILSPLLPLKPFLNELWDPCEKIKTKMIKCLLALKFCQFPLHDSHIPRPTCVCIFTQKKVTTQD